MEEVEPLSQKNTSGSICDWEGLLNITIPMAVDGVQNRSLKFEFVHDTAPNALGFPSFHIGDSDSNDAYGGGCTTTSHCAQIFNQGDTLKIRANAEPGHPTPLFASEPNFITQKVDIVVGDKFIVAENLNEIEREYCSNFLFALNGAPPSVGVADYSVHLGMNRLIEESFRTRRHMPAKGLCHVEVLALTCTSVEFESETEGATVATSIMP